MTTIVSIALLAAPNAPVEAAEETVDTTRIVAIGGSVTEILYELGLEKQIVAVDTTSVFPPQALTEKPNVGYMRRLSTEGVLSLNPSLILAIEGAGPPDVIEVLKNASVPFISVPNTPSAEGSVAKVKFVAEAVGVEAKGKALVEKLTREFAALRETVLKLKEKKRPLFILSLRDGRVMASGTNTAADGILALAGAENAVQGFEGYKPLSDEAIITSAPDTILMMSRTRGHGASKEEVFALPAMKATPAAQKQAFLKIDGAYMLGFGPRTAMAARDLGKSLYPDVEWPDFEDVQTEVRQ